MFAGEDGDPTGGVASQTVLRPLFVDHTTLQAEFKIGSWELSMQQVRG